MFGSRFGTDFSGGSGQCSVGADRLGLQRLRRKISTLTWTKCSADALPAAGSNLLRAEHDSGRGSIEVDGRGTLLTTETCLLNPNRNPSLSRQEIERYLCDYLAVTKVLWLAGSVVGDDTDGHIDEQARFVAPGTVVAAVGRRSARRKLRPAPRQSPTFAGVYRRGRKIAERHTVADAAAR